MPRRPSIISPHTRRLLKSKGIKVVTIREFANTTREKIKHANGDYNILEYNIIVRKYLMRRYEVSARQLDMCCFLYPKGVFTKADFKGWKVVYSGYSIKQMIKEGLLQIFMKGSKGQAYVYELTQKGKSMTQLYHRYLMDIERLPADAYRKRHIRAKVGGKRHGFAQLIDKLEARP